MYNVNIIFFTIFGNIETRMPNPILPASIKVYLKNKKGAQYMYRLLSKTKDTPTGKISWNKKYSLTDNEWNKIYIEPFKSTKDTVIQWFQTRINHKILATNTFLSKIKLANDPKCTFCKKFNETIEHLFWDCECVQKIVSELVHWLSQHDILP